MSCKGRNQLLNSIDDDKNIPTLVIDSLNVNYTESGILRMNVQAPVMERYMLAEEPYSIFPQGIHIRFYDKTNELESEILADYAYNKEKPEEFWQAINNVVIINYPQQQTLYTDTLYWNRAQKTIYTDAPVKIVTPDSEINGQYGMTSDERFENYEIRSVYNSHILFTEEEPTEQKASSGDTPVSEERLSANQPARKTEAPTPVIEQPVAPSKKFPANKESTPVMKAVGKSDKQLPARNKD
jgi:LPS export ABC transporter protein LptC